MASFKYGSQDPSKFNLLGDRVMVEVLDVEDVLKSGFVLPDVGESRRGWMAGKVVRVGDGHRLERDESVPMFVKVGDTCIMERLTGKDFKIGGKDYRILSQVDVLAVVSE